MNVRPSAFLTCELCHGHGYEQTEDGKEECSACNPDGETLREHGRDEMSEELRKWSADVRARMVDVIDDLEPAAHNLMMEAACVMLAMEKSLAAASSAAQEPGQGGSGALAEPGNTGGNPHLPPESAGQAPSAAPVDAQAVPETLVESIAGCISKHMTVATYPREVLDAAREITAKYAAAVPPLQISPSSDAGAVTARDAQDAKRYRWLRNAAMRVDWAEGKAASEACYWIKSHCRVTPEQMDMAIDAAMEGGAA